MGLAIRIVLGMIGVGLAPWIARGQQHAQTVHRIGWISTETEPDPFIDGFREGLRKHGYVEGQNLALELRYSPGNVDGLRAAIEDLVRRKVAFIVSSGPAIRAARSARDVWILFAISGDPIELGIAQTLARPGGNFTGSTFVSLTVAEKRVQLLNEALPQLRSLAVLSNTDHPGERSEWRATEKAARALALDVRYVAFAGLRELDGALDGVRNARVDAMIVFPEGVTMANRVKLAQFALAHRLPSMFGWSEFCEAGGLMSYGANQRETYVRLAAYADRLLRGEKPGDLPIELPTRFELVVNLNTARLLDLALAGPVLSRADTLIQ